MTETGRRRSPVPRTRGRPRLGDGAALERPRLVETLFRIAVERGVAALQMRTIARELGVSPRLLYHLVKDKDGMIDMLADEILARGIPDTEGAGWQERLRNVATAVRDAYRPFPGLLAATIARGGDILRQPHAAAMRSITLSALSDTGLDEAAVYDAYLRYSTMLIGSMLLSESVGRTASPLDPQLALEASFAKSLELFLADLAFESAKVKAPT